MNYVEFVFVDVVGVFEHSIDKDQALVVELLSQSEIPSAEAGEVITDFIYHG